MYYALGGVLGLRVTDHFVEELGLGQRWCFLWNFV